MKPARRRGLNPLVPNPALVVVVGMLVATTANIAEGGEHQNPYASDPLGLTAYCDKATERGMASDVYEVWTSQIAGGPHQLPLVTPDMLVRDLEHHIAKYWETQSGGAYRVSLVAGGRVQNPTGDCRTAVREVAREKSDNTSNGALIIMMDSYSPGSRGRHNSALFERV